MLPIMEYEVDDDVDSLLKAVLLEVEYHVGSQ